MANDKGSGYKHKVLIVDDESLNIEFLQTLLSEEINVIFATSGEDALSIVAANRPDMILLDIMMPGMDGYEVCKRLKGNPDTKDIPVIFVTAKDGPEEEARGLELGAIDYIIKPFNPEIVKSKVRNNIIRIATPRPDLEQHHNKERRASGGSRRDRRTSDRSGIWKGVAIGALVIAILAVVIAILPADKTGLDGLMQMVGQGSSSSGTTNSTNPPAASSPSNQTTPGNSVSTPTAPSANTSQSARTRDRSSPVDMKWVENSDCPVIPEVPWWRFVSHTSIVRYVERNLQGDWETYAEKWQSRLQSVQNIFERNSTAITNTGVELSGDALEEYIGQMKIRVEAINCLRAEAKQKAGN
jgi:CheY-like chemotaxis protein